jgi:putative membrane protein
MMRLLALTSLCIASAAETAFGHAGHETGGGIPTAANRGPRNWDELMVAWEFDPLVVLPLVLSAYWYAAGLTRIWRDAGVGRGIRRWEAASFWSGWLALLVALVSPLHQWGNMLFSVHMSQHEVLMLVAAPLMVLGKPLVGMLKGLPQGWARSLVRASAAPAWQFFWKRLNNPLVAWAIHAIVLWVWHIPFLFEATLTDDFVHALQHLSFVLSALLFWWAVTQGPQRAFNFGVAVLYMFSTALHSGALGALITFASTVWYPAYSSTAPEWGLTPLEDQQLGGAIMWIPACVVYIIASLALVVGAMRSSEERVLQWERLQTRTRCAEVRP